MELIASSNWRPHPYQALKDKTEGIFALLASKVINK